MRLFRRWARGDSETKQQAKKPQPRRQLDASEVEIAAALRAEGKSLREIASELGCSVKAVVTGLRHAAPPQPRKVDLEAELQLIALDGVRQLAGKDRRLTLGLIERFCPIAIVPEGQEDHDDGDDDDDDRSHSQSSDIEGTIHVMKELMTFSREITEGEPKEQGSGILAQLAQAFAPIILGLIQAQQNAAVQQAAMLAQGGVINVQPVARAQITQAQAGAIPAAAPAQLPQEEQAVPPNDMVIYGFDIGEFLPLLDLTPELAAEVLWKRSNERLEQGDAKLAEVIETLDQTGDLIIRMLLSASAAKYQTIVPRLLQDNWVFKAKARIQELIDLEGDAEAEEIQASDGINGSEGP